MEPIIDFNSLYVNNEYDEDRLTIKAETMAALVATYFTRSSKRRSMMSSEAGIPE
jgi:hypothetical protein